MRQYEIRILSSSNALALALNGSYVSDLSAIGAAQHLRHDNQIAQVWCGDECIYQEGMALDGVAPYRPAA